MEHSTSVQAEQEFWRLIASINWEENPNAVGVKNKLKKWITPLTATKMRAVLLHFTKQLVEAYIQSPDREEVNLADLEFAASNIVGRGSFEYDQYMMCPSLIKHEIEDVDVVDNFLLAFPTDDDYFY